MDIPRKQNKPRTMDDFYAEHHQPEEPLLPSPHDMEIEEHSRDVLKHWRGPEYESYNFSARTLTVLGLALIGLAALFIIQNNPIPAITFILIGIVGYLYLQKEPRMLDFMITSKGVLAGRELYDFENIESFWIFYDPPRTRILSIKVEHSFLPFVHIPIHDENPVEIRHILLDFIPEIKQDPTIIDAFEKMIHK